jgi:two-component system response regulator NreC
MRDCPDGHEVGKRALYRVDIAGRHMEDGIIRILIADDHSVVRAGLKSLLDLEPDIRVIAEVGNGTDAVTYARRLRPDVVIMDLTMPGMDGITATREIVQHVPAVRVLVVTVHPEDELLLPAMSAGAAGYLVKSEADREVATAVRTVARGERYLGPAAQRVVANRENIARVDVDGARYRLLSERERKILGLVAEGCSAAEIGARLTINPKSVERYERRIEDKLNFTKRSDYLRFARTIGVIGLGREGEIPQRG